MIRALHALLWGRALEEAEDADATKLLAEIF